MLRLPREPRDDGTVLRGEPARRIGPVEDDVEVGHLHAEPRDRVRVAVALAALEPRVDDDALEVEQRERLGEVLPREHGDLRHRDYVADAREERVEPERDVAQAPVPEHEEPPRTVARGALEDAVELVAAELAHERADHRAPRSSSIAAVTSASPIACMHFGAGHSAVLRPQRRTHAISRLNRIRWSRHGNGSTVTAR